jgi:hypothetical protein
MLRLWATSTETSPGWLRAGMDPDIGGVLDAIHALLLGTSETAKQIARRTGYKSDAAFNRAFTRHHGCSPGQWRHEHITS